jgi:hypothetical protein
MGFRSTLVTQHNYLPLPEWFIEKYKDRFYMNGSDYPDGTKNGLPIASRFEIKTYFPHGEELPADIQKVIRESADDTSIELVFVWLHECGGITRVQIDKDNIIYSEPTEWEVTQGVTHHYCYGCSDVTPIENPNHPTQGEVT